jgi:hypothetical protein
MVKLDKAGEDERSAVAEFIEEKWGVELSRPDARRKIYRDQNGVAHWIFVGVGTWHGFNKSMAEEAANEKGHLIVGICESDLTQISVFSAPLEGFAKIIPRLSRDSKGGREFTLERKGTEVAPKEAPWFRLASLGICSYSGRTKDGKRAGRELKRDMARMSQDELVAFHRRLQEMADDKVAPAAQPRKIGSE